MNEEDKKQTGDQQIQISSPLPKANEPSEKLPEARPQALLKGEEDVPFGRITEARDRPDDIIILKRQDDVNDTPDLTGVFEDEATPKDES